MHTKAIEPCQNTRKKYQLKTKTMNMMVLLQDDKSRINDAFLTVHLLTVSWAGINSFICHQWNSSSKLQTLAINFTMFKSSRILTVFWSDAIHPFSTVFYKYHIVTLIKYKELKDLKDFAWAHSTPRQSFWGSSAWGLKAFPNKIIGSISRKTQKTQKTREKSLRS